MVPASRLALDLSRAPGPQAVTDHREPMVTSHDVRPMKGRITPQRDIQRLQILRNKTPPLAQEAVVLDAPHQRFDIRDIDTPDCGLVCAAKQRGEQLDMRLERGDIACLERSSVVRCEKCSIQRYGDSFDRKAASPQPGVDRLGIPWKRTADAFRQRRWPATNSKGSSACRSAT